MNNRKHVRISTDKAARIIFAPGPTQVMCIVRDISEGGAGLSVATTDGIPDNFTLAIKGETQLRACTVRWKESNKLGVSFD